MLLWRFKATQCTRVYEVKLIVIYINVSRLLLLLIIHICPSREFIEEYLTLKEDGFYVADRLYKVKIQCIVCDAQARAFIKGCYLTKFMV